MSSGSVDSWESLGERVARARRVAGLTQEDLAGKLSLDRTAISKIETGQRHLDSLELGRVARALGRTVEWFLLPVVPTVVSRRTQREDSAETSADLMLEDFARDVEQLIDLKALRSPPSFSLPAQITDVHTAEAAASAARTSAQVGAGPLRELLPVVEKFGLFVLCLPFGAADLDGSYVSLANCGVALVNGRHDSGRRRFTLIHELGHHLSQDEYSSEWIVEGEDQAEKLISAFAIHFLMPRASVEPRWHVLRQTLENRAAAIVLAAEYGVSWTATCTQLVNLHLISTAELKKLIAALPTASERMELGVNLFPDLVPPAVSPAYGAAVVRAFRSRKIAAGRTLALLHGTLTESELPEPNPVPLEAWMSDGE